MKILSGKKIIISSFIIIASLSMYGCNSSSTSNSNNVANSANNTSNSTGNTTNSSSNTTNSTAVNSASNSTSGNSTISSASQKLLDSISDAANSGKVINCDFAAKETTMSDVKAQWGNADSSSWITAAKGMYYTYSKHNIVLGANKGDQVFEVRSTDTSLSALKLSDVESKFGTPQYNVTSDGQNIIGYKISDEFKILFVFNVGATNPALLHYSILYPAGTVNSMAGDPGRQW